jgi:hypothetical protein
VLKGHGKKAFKKKEGKLKKKRERQAGRKSEGGKLE